MNNGMPTVVSTRRGSVGLLSVVHDETLTPAHLLTTRMSNGGNTPKYDNAFLALSCCFYAGLR